MLVRIVQFVLGAGLAGGGGYVAWTERAGFAHIFPPGEAGLPVMLLAGLLGLSASVVLLVSAVHPRPNRRRALAARAVKEAEALAAAETYYSERSRAADRDWRSDDILPPAQATPPAAPSSPPAPPLTPMAPPAPEAGAVAADPTPPIAPEPAPAPAPTGKPVASATPPPPGAFPAAATLAPIPRSEDLPPPVNPAAPAPPPSAEDPHAAIRAAIAEGRLEEAERMLTAGRETAQGLALAELTGLAGDHAAASGRQSHAKWLWRLAMKRFGELNALDSAAARSVAESLRTAG